MTAPIQQGWVSSRESTDFTVLAHPGHVVSLINQQPK